LFNTGARLSRATFHRGDAMNAMTQDLPRPGLDPRFDPARVIRAPRGPELSCKSWLTEAAYRMIQNNLDAEVAENPQSLVVYGGIGRAAPTGNASTRSSPRCAAWKTTRPS